MRTLCILMDLHDETKFDVDDAAASDESDGVVHSFIQPHVAANRQRCSGALLHGHLPR